MATPIQAYRDFLAKAWNPQSYNLWHKSRYDVLSTTASRDLLQNLHFGEEVDILLVGIGDIRHIVKTISCLNDSAKQKHSKSLRFYANDIDVAVIARDILLLEIITNLDLDLGDDFDFLWCVWYNIALKPHHHTRLVQILERLSMEELRSDRCWSLEEDDLVQVRAVWKSWSETKHCHSHVMRERLITMMEDYYNMRRSDAEDMLNENDSIRLSLNTKFVTVCLVNVYQLVIGKLILGTNPEFPSEVDKFSKEVEEFYHTGCADPHYGTKKAFPRLCMPRVRDSWPVNPTMMRPGASLFHVDYYAAPFYSFFPLAIDGSSDHAIQESLGETCFKKMRSMVHVCRNLLDSRKVQIKVRFSIGDAVAHFSNNPCPQKYDFINVSISDDVGLVTVLLLLKSKLKSTKSVLCTESLHWRRFNSTVEDWYNSALIQLPPSLLPTVLGVRLADDFEMGRIEPMTWCQRKGFEVYQYREMLFWTRSLCEKPSPVSLKDSCALKRYLKGVVNKIFKQRDEYDFQFHTPYWLWRVVQQLGKRVKGGVASVLEVVRCELPFSSPRLWEWNTITALHGHIGFPDPDKVLHIRVPIKVEPGIAKNGKKKESLFNQPVTRTIVLMSKVFFEKKCAKEEIMAFLKEHDLGKDVSITFQYIGNTKVGKDFVEFFIRKSVWDTQKSGLHLCFRDATNAMDPICLHDPANVEIVNVITLKNEAEKMDQHKSPLLIVEKEGTYEVVIQKKKVCSAKCFKFEETRDPHHVRIACTGSCNVAASYDLRFSCPVRKNKVGFGIQWDKPTLLCVVPKDKANTIGPAIVPKCRIDLKGLKRDTTNFLVNRRYYDSMLCIPGDAIILPQDLDDSVRNKYTFLVIRMALSGMTRQRHITTYTLGEHTVIHTKSVYWYRNMPFVHVFFCSLATLQADEPRLTRGQCSDSYHKALAIRKNILVGSEHAYQDLLGSPKTADILLAYLEANSLQLEQPYTSTFPDLKQSYIQLHFPRLSPVAGLGYDVFSKLNLKKGQLSDEDKVFFKYSIPHSKYHMKVEDTCAYCGKYSIHLPIQSQTRINDIQLQYCSVQCSENGKEEVKKKKANPVFDVKIEKEERKCALCGAKNPDKECAKCHSVYYCGRICQVSHWKKHKKVCRDLAIQKALRDGSVKDVLSTKKKFKEKVKTSTSRKDGGGDTAGLVDGISNMNLKADGQGVTSNKAGDPQSLKSQNHSLNNPTTTKDSKTNAKTTTTQQTNPSTKTANEQASKATQSMNQRVDQSASTVEMGNSAKNMDKDKAKESSRPQGQSKQSTTSVPPGEVNDNEGDKSKKSKKSKDTVYCNECVKACRSVKRCALCKKVAYCSKDCQKRAWPVHRLYCEGKKS